MAKSKAKLPPLSKHIHELVDFFDSHDLGDEWERMPEAHFEVAIKKRKHLVVLEADLAAKLTEIARAKKVSSETLINTWLKEKIRKAS
jgi:hypothetical protein